jgi:hypothetical protein
VSWLGTSRIIIKKGKKARGETEGESGARAHHPPPSTKNVMSTQAQRNCSSHQRKGTKKSARGHQLPTPENQPENHVRVSCTLIQKIIQNYEKNRSG